MLRCCLLYSFGLVLYFWVICVGLITHWSVLHGAGFCHMSYDDRRQWQGLLLLSMIVFSFIQCLLDALTGVWHSLTVGESRSYFCLALIYGFKVSLLSAVRLASSAVLSSWRGLLSLTDCHLWPGQTWVKSWCPSTWTGCPMKRHSTSFLVYLFLMLWWIKICLRFIPTEFKVQDKCHVLAQDQKAASDTIPEDPIPRALYRVCSSGSVVHPKECYWIQHWHIITLINIVAQVSGIAAMLSVMF